MALSKFFVVAMATLANFAHAAPAPISNRQDSSLPFPVEHFTKTVASVQNTYCGSAANQPGVKFGDQTLLYALGNGDTVQRTNIYHSDSLGIIVAYQGTNLSSIVSIAQDIEALPVLPDPRLGLPIGCLVFAGWQVAWTNGWSAVKAALADVIQTYPNDKVIVTGHSQGAAIALLGALSIRKEFGDIIQEVIAYGIPRVGNPKFANAFDAAFGGKYTGVVNGEDWVPSFPTRPVYRHPSGMVWINPANTTSWQFYQGQENPNGPSSRIGKIFYPGTFQFYWGDHQGIYMHSSMGTTLGPCPAKVGGF
ncbi:putative secretory lipase (family 3) [Fusarium albosuccineum]|uniref:Putative secretory lipase (Family 3) n=1 Tax=Fusarium albosuccineum TaxID=1237068 RepID=A0A8H4NQE3_9HYPO|nr:putative secretory lipase (family 3) [Fusarium albosuccineum]